MSAPLIYNRVRTNGKRGYVRLIHDDVFDPLQGLHVRRRYLRAFNAVAAGSNVGRMGGNTTHEVSSNRNLSVLLIEVQLQLVRYDGLAGEILQLRA